MGVAMTEKKPKKQAKKEKPVTGPGRVTAIDIQHALRASLLLDTADSRGQSTYSSLEVGIQIHVEGIPEGVDYKDVIAHYDEEVVKLVADRVNLDARSLGFRAFTDYKDEDPIETGTEALEVSDSEL
jgi:hypothetical protein